jgi:hypothetical protein
MSTPVIETKRRPGRRRQTGASPAALSCPRCGLVLRVQPPWIDTEYCPRCLAYAHTTVKLTAHPSTPVP